MTEDEFVDSISNTIEKNTKTTRTFDTGANRNSDEGKLDYEGAFSPLVLRRCAEYSLKHNAMEDGSMRAADNWQKGMPLSVYMKSMWRHFMFVWTSHRGGYFSHMMEDALCGVIFNASGYLHELLKKKLVENPATLTEADARWKKDADI